MARLHLAGSLVVLLTGCAAEAPPPKAAPIPADLEAWTSASTPAGASVRRLTLSPERAADEEAPRFGVAPKRIAARPDAAPRPRGRSRVDVSFQGADMVNAFQFLAEAGRFNLVMQDGLGGKVSATLRGVDPFDALVSLAEANGATVRYDREIVVVSRK
jgi:hypothetical protein